MTERSFSLLAFPNSNPPAIEITGKIARRADILTIEYDLTGKTDAILFPGASNGCARRDELWKATCFEIFLALPGQPAYWEFNFSPSRDWNVYHIDSYRRVGFRDETLITELPVSFEHRSDCTSLRAKVDLHLIVAAQQPIQVGITSVIQTQDGQETYWALVHPNPQPDFHLRESFILTLS